MMWAAVLVGSLGCYLEKLVGYFLPAAVLEKIQQIPGVKQAKALKF